jgi:hypothetical protein
VALMKDAAKNRMGMPETALDARVIKSVLMATSDRTEGWNNGQTTAGGVVRTTQSLDYATGAGRMDLATTFGLQVAGQTDVLGTGTGSLGTVARTGWDYGAAVRGTTNDYVIAGVLTGSTTLTASLDWLRNRFFDFDTTEYADVAQADLNLSIWELDGSNGFTTLVARSESLYNTVEYLSFLLPRSGHYGLRVEYPVNTFDNTTGGIWGTVAFPQSYAVSWIAVPEPSLAATTLAAVAIAATSAVPKAAHIRTQARTTAALPAPQTRVNLAAARRASGLSG